MVVNTYIKREESSQSNNLTSHLKKLEKEEPTKPKEGRREEIIKIRVKINKIENKKTIQNISETQNWFYESNKVDKSLAMLKKM